MSAQTLRDSGPRRHSRIRSWLLLAFAAVLILLMSFAGLTVIGIRTSNVELLRAQQSLSQLENIRAVEAAFNLYLLDEIRRRLTADPEYRESAAAAALRGAIFAYRRKIGEEIALAGSEEQRAGERGEMVRASALSELFETIETEAMIERLTRRGQSGTDDARSFLANVAAGRDKVFQAVIFEIAQDERAEAQSAFDRLAALRRRLVAVGSALAAAFAVAVMAFGVLFYRGLMRPIRKLTDAVEGFRGTLAGGRAPVDLPSEYAVLAERFNAMAERIETEQQRLQAEVAARTEELERANRSLRRVDRTRRAFFANISHELRTPVTVLLGEAQVALRTPGDERGALERVAANSGFLRRRLDDLLQLARSEDGELKLRAEPVELTAAVGEAVEAVRAYAAANEIDLVFRAGPEIAVTGDHEALRQVALALLDNAIKFSPPGSEVEVFTAGTRFTVQDSGPGFGTLDIEALFDRYAQTNSGRNQGGAGLGLAIVKWIADQHGARVLAEEAPAGGARISLEFAE